MILVRITLLFCLFHLLSMFHVEHLHTEGELLCKLRNQPHRGLGMLYYAHIKYPNRPDYLRDYIVQYLIYIDGEMLIEGQTRPVVNMYAVAMAREFPKNKEIQLLRNIIMHNHFKRMQDKEKKQ